MITKLQSVLFGFNVLLMIFGVTALVLGGVLHGYMTLYVPSTDSVLCSCSIPIIVLGILVTVITIPMIIRVNNQCYLIAYVVFLVLCLCLALGCLIAMKRWSNVETRFSDLLETYVENYNYKPDAKRRMDLIQQRRHCCGVNGPFDYSIRPFPESCKHGSEYYSEGCKESLDATLNSFRISQYTVLPLNSIVIVVCLVFVLIQLINGDIDDKLTLI